MVRAGVPVLMSLALSLASTAAVVWGWPLLRKRLLDFGSTAEEQGRELAGDELLPEADLIATRAISIDAPPAAVWPWLVQIGTGRAGAYAYDWLDRRIGLDMHSSWQIMPEFGDLAIGDVIPVANDGTGLRVQRLETARVLGCRTDDDTWAWTWILEQDGAGTRLLSRTRMLVGGSGRLRRASTELFLIPASWLMERKMLEGLKAPAEGMPAPE